MTLHDVIRILRRSWLLIVACTLLGLLVGAGSTLAKTPLYTATTKVFVTVQAGGSSPSDLVQGNSAAQQKVTSYIDVVTSAAVLQPVIDELKLHRTVPSLASAVSASSPVNSVVIDISAEDPDPATAARLAAAIGASFAKVVPDTLEKSETGDSLVSINTIEPPLIPTTPSSPILALALAAGTALGLMTGLAIAFVRSLLDTKVRSAQDIETLTDLPILGGIGYDPGAQREPLIIHSDPRSPRAEAFRTVRTNVQFVDLDETAKTFTLTSALPSEGKTTTAANLAIAMAENGARVALIDADLRRPRVADILGLEGSVGLTDTLIGKAAVEDVLQPWGAGGLHVLPAGRIPPNPSELLGGRRMVALLEQLSAEFDYVIIDAPPLLPVTDAAILSRITAGVLLISASGRATRNQLRLAVDALSSVGSRVFGVVMTMVPTKGANAYAYGTYYAYYGSGASRVDESAVGPARGRRAAKPTAEVA